MCFVSLNFVRLRVHANIEERGKTMPTTRAVHKETQEGMQEGMQKATAVRIFKHRGRSRAPSPEPRVPTSDAGSDSVNEQ
jgi:hypothetical protein